MLPGVTEGDAHGPSAIKGPSEWEVSWSAV